MHQRKVTVNGVRAPSCNLSSIAKRPNLAAAVERPRCSELRTFGGHLQVALLL
jgi:hypothetical protein